MSNLLAGAGLEKIVITYADEDGNLHVRVAIITPAVRAQLLALLDEEGT